MEEKVSIIITTFRRPVDVLKRAIESAINQTYQNKEIIIVNDAPDFVDRDRIDTLINQYDIIYHVNECSKGAAYSRNIGAKYSTGAYLAYLDDDDEWMLDKIEKMISVFKPGVGLVYCDMLVINGNEEYVQKLNSYPQNRILEKLLDRNYIGGFSGPIISKRVFEEIGRMDESLLSSQDADLWRRIAKVSEFIKIDEPLIKYYISSDSISGNPQKRLQGTIALLKKFDVDYRKYPKSRRSHINRSVQNYIRSGWYKAAFTLYKTSYNIYEKLINAYIIPLGVAKKILLRR